MDPSPPPRSDAPPDPSDPDRPDVAEPVVPPDGTDGVQELIGTDVEAVVRVIARLWPKRGTDIEPMIEDVADFVWKQDFGAPIHEVQVRWQDPESGRNQRRIVGRPGRSRVLRLYGTSGR